MSFSRWLNASPIASPGMLTTGKSRQTSPVIFGSLTAAMTPPRREPVGLPAPPPIEAAMLMDKDQSLEGQAGEFRGE